MMLSTSAPNKKVRYNVHVHVFCSGCTIYYCCVSITNKVYNDIIKLRDIQTTLCNALYHKMPFPEANVVFIIPFLFDLKLSNFIICRTLHNFRNILEKYHYPHISPKILV